MLSEIDSGKDTSLGRKDLSRNLEVENCACVKEHTSDRGGLWVQNLTQEPKVRVGRKSEKVRSDGLRQSGGTRVFKSLSII